MRESLMSFPFIDHSLFRTSEKLRTIGYEDPSIMYNTDRKK